MREFYQFVAVIKNVEFFIFIQSFEAFEMMIIGVIRCPLESSSAEWGRMDATLFARLLLFPAESEAEEFLNAANRPFLA